MGVSTMPPKEVERIPRSGTERIPKSLVTKDVPLLVFGPGIGEIAYGKLAAAISLRL
jgi:hypothetical protein